MATEEEMDKHMKRKYAKRVNYQDITLLKISPSQTELERYTRLLRYTSEEQRTCLGQLCQNRETYPDQHKQTPPILALFETGDLCLG